jgi:hypothetical protein
MSETRLKIKSIGVGFVQIGAAKSHRQRFLESSKNGRRLHTLHLNETYANIFNFTLASLVIGSR